MIEVRNTINATWVRCLVALIAELFGTWLTNAALYPQYIGVMSEARDASSLVGVVTLVALAVWALKKPRPSTRPP
mgnify:FL=1